MVVYPTSIQNESRSHAQLADQIWSRPNTSTSKLFFFLLIGAFLVFSPISVSGFFDLETVHRLKWIRVGLGAFAAAIGLQWWRHPSGSEKASVALLWLTFVFCVAAIWSSSPIWGLLTKGLFVCAIVTGMAAAYSLRTEADYRAFARCMTFTAVIAFLLVGYCLTMTDAWAFGRGRLEIAGINPNTLSQVAAIFTLLCGFHVMLGDRRPWTHTATICCVIMTCLIIGSGSRGSLLMVLCGGAVLLPGAARHRRQIVKLQVVSASIILAIAYSWSQMSPAENVDVRIPSSQQNREAVKLRILSDVMRNTRPDLYRWVTVRCLNNPIWGEGWSHDQNHWRVVQSAYLQIAIEAGLIGVVMLLIFLWTAIDLILTTLRRARRATGLLRLLSFAFSGTLAALLLHAAFEASAITGTSAVSVLLGFCVAQLDNLHLLQLGRTSPPLKQSSVQVICSRTLKIENRTVDSGPAKQDRS